MRALPEPALIYLYSSKQVSNSNTDHEFIKISCRHCFKTFNVPVYCGDRFCPVCSFPRLARVRNRLQHILRKVRQTKTVRTRFLTLTISNQSNLADMVQFLVQSFRKYRSSKIWKSAVKGGAFVIEVTGSPGDWHAHLHLIILSDWMSFKDHQPLWQRITGGRGWYCKLIPPAQCVRYLSKYLAKPSVLDADLSPVSSVLQGYRLFQTFGDWYGSLADYHKPEYLCTVCGGRNFLPMDILLRSLHDEGWETHPDFWDNMLSPDSS